MLEKLKDKYVFFDVDGTLSEYRYNDKLYSGACPELGCQTLEDLLFSNLFSKARPLKDEVLKSYLGLLEQEIDIVRPKIIITFGNQVSSIILNKKISVGECRKQYFEKEIGRKTYKVFPVYYPVGNGTFNIDKAIEDLKYIIENYVKDTIRTK